MTEEEISIAIKAMADCRDGAPPKRSGAIYAKWYGIQYEWEQIKSQMVMKNGKRY
jgi:hypothetical protein